MRQGSTPKNRGVAARTRTAYHEAGHAVLSAAIANPPEHVTIKADGHTLGRSGARMSARPTARVQVHLAGFAAEHQLTGRRPRQLDQEIGFSLLARLDPALGDAYAGSEVRDGHRAVEEVLRLGTYDDDDAVRREVDRFYEVARKSLSVVWPSVKAVAKALLQDEEIDRTGFDEALGDADLYAPVFAVQLEHGLLRPVEASPSAGRAEGPLVEAAMSSDRKLGKKSAQAAAAKSGARIADPRIADLLKMLRRAPKLAATVEAYEKQAAEPGRRFGKNGLKTKDGKLFALFTQDTLVVKLPNERVVSLVADRLGKPFDPGHGRLMKGWLTVTNEKASWVDLAKEAHEFVSNGSRTKGGRS